MTALKIPGYTKEKLAKLSIADIKLVKERAEKEELLDLVLMCLEVLEEKKPIETRTNNKESKQKRAKNSQAISWFFEDLGAPLVNNVWSWGAISLVKNDVFLRVWADEIKFEDGCRLVQLTFHSMFRGKNNLGYEERLRHVESIKNKSNGFAVICEAVDIKKKPRKIKSYDREKLYPILKIVEIKGDNWGELGPGKNISEYLS